MSTYSACPDTIYLPHPSAETRCAQRKAMPVTNLSQPYWNPNSERCETLQQSIQQGRRERALAIAAFFSRWLRR